MPGNIYTFHLPELGEGVMEGEVVEWLKQIGDPVQQDEAVVTVMTDKATVELPSPYPGKIYKHYYKPGEIAIKDRPLYDIELQEGQSDTAAAPPPAQEASEQSSKPIHSDNTIKPSRKQKAESQTSGKSAVKAIPKVRHEAKEWNIDLKQVTGTGGEGRITENDLHQALHHKKPSSTQSPCPNLPGDEVQPLVGVRGLMARKMHETHIPQFSYFEYVDATRLIQLRGNMKSQAHQERVALSFMPFFIRALSLTIKEYPQINASLDMDAGKAILHKQHHIGIAMASSQGLIVPVLKGVENMSVIQLISAYESLKARAVAGKLSPSDMKEATITISNFGVLEGEGMWATPMISSPEVTILAIAKMRKMPIVKEEQVVVQETIPLSWSFDHRLIDGEIAARVSHHYSALLKNPASLL